VGELANGFSPEVVCSTAIPGVCLSSSEGEAKDLSKIVVRGK